MSLDNDPWGDNPKNTQGGEFARFLESLKSKWLGGGDSSQKNNGHGDMPPIPKKLVAVAAGVAFIVWGSTGIYILPEGFNAVELTFGKYTQTAVQPGFNFRMPYPIGTVKKVDVGSLNNLTVGGDRGGNTEGQMLTSDENIVEVSLSVQYKIGKPEAYLFNVSNPEKVLKETLISSIREVVGASSVDYILTDGRAEWPAQVKDNLIQVLKGFDIGFDIVRVELKEAKAPQEVQEAFDDAVKAREDAERYKLQAEAYQNEQVPLARGQAQEIIQKANGEKVAMIAKATGEAEFFNQLLSSYQQAPEVTKQRMYIETMQKLYGQVNNIVVDTGDKSPLLYIPANTTNSNAPLPSPNAIYQPNINQLPNYTSSESGQSAVENGSNRSFDSIQQITPNYLKNKERLVR